MHNNVQHQIKVLDTRIRFLGKIKVKDHLEALDRIGLIGTPSDVRYIVHHVFSKNKSISQKTAAVIRRLLTGATSTTAWSNLYDSFSGYYSVINTTNIKKVKYATPEEFAHLYGLASLNHNGYVREKALGHLKNYPAHEVLPYILIRLNDWVPQVRRQAKESLYAILPSVHIADLVKHHFLIDRLENANRVDLTNVQNAIFTHICTPKNRPILFEVMQNAPLGERIFCWKALTEEVRIDEALIDKAIADSTPEIRQWAARHLPISGSYQKRLKRLLSDRAVRVRYAALKTIQQGDFLEYEECIKNAIFDDSKPIRERARSMSDSLQGSTHADRYRQKLSELKDKANPGVLLGLSETGTKEDVPLIKKYVDHKTSRVRAAALAGLGKLETKSTSLYIQGLQDGSAKVRNTCISILKSNHAHVRPELELLLESRTVKVQIASLTVLRHYGTLDSLRDILFSLTSLHEDLQEMAWRYLASWHHQNRAKLWFRIDDATLKETMALFDKLRRKNANPPRNARNAWEDMPNILRMLTAQK